jgi:SAM-dependent methyltransferase
VGYRSDLYNQSFEENREAVLTAVTGLRVQRMLDAGCGDGVFTAQIADRAGAAEVHGIEIDPDRADGARTRGLKVEEADLGQPLPYPAGHFDLIVSHHVIEHVHNTDLHVSELCRVAADSATIVISTNNLSSWHNIGFLLFGWQPTPMHVSDQVILGNPINDRDGTRFDTPGDSHHRLFTVRALRELCGFHGLAPRRVSTVGYYPFTGKLARVFSTLDWRHGAFIVGVFVPLGPQVT